ncbi:hypothetical protein FRC00_000266 [Tulasnella sp. 408]|nr:hypothetical protein FRC00_000266 [Tulasnella sp. 408]
MSVGIFTPSGPGFSKTYAVLCANKTDPSKRGKPDEDSLYRIASVSKMFNVYEMMALKEKGLLNWDDPVENDVKNVTYYPDGWEKYLSESQGVSIPGGRKGERDSITLRQLATHLAGIGLDYTPIATIKELPLVAPPYAYPIYSNIGFNVLGWAVGAAAEKTATNVVMPASGSYETDLAFGPYNPSASQFSSLKDLVKVMQTFLHPSRKESLLSTYSMREWLRPLHGFPDDLTEVGAAWEIVKVPDTNGNPRRWRQLANLALHVHLRPTTSFGIVVLMTGLDHNAHKVATNAIQTFKRAFDQLLEQATMQLYGGYWKSDDGKSEAITYVEKGSLWLSRLFLNGDVLEGPLYTRGRRYGLWTTERDVGFRVAIGRPEEPDDVFAGCFPEWVTMDPIFAKGAPVDLILFGWGPDERVAKVPSVDVVMKRNIWRYRCK